MLPPDHYKTLGVAPNASAEDIKKAFRNLAHRYHPDKATENPFAASYFHELHRAYTILSDKWLRKRYDEERYFAGLSSRKEPEAISTEWLLIQSENLRSHMQKLDSYHINHKALHHYVMLFFSDAHLSVLKHENKLDIQQKILENMLEAVRRIDGRYVRKIADLLYLLAGRNESMSLSIEKFIRQRKQKHLLDRYAPLMIIVLTLVLCLLMYLYARR